MPKLPRLLQKNIGSAKKQSRYFTVNYLLFLQFLPDDLFEVLLEVLLLALLLALEVALFFALLCAKTVHHTFYLLVWGYLAAIFRHLQCK